jgi:hypothetical protein
LLAVILYLFVSECGNDMNINFQYEEGYSLENFTTNLKKGRYEVDEKSAARLKSKLSSLPMGVSRQDIIEKFGDPDLIVGFSSKFDGKVIRTFALTGGFRLFTFFSSCILSSSVKIISIWAGIEA